MASIDSLKASDGSGNASVATVQNARSAGATTLIVDTVQGINTNFHGTMGTPHTFTDPVTGEEITIISEATAVDFKGHVDGSNLEIDTIAPGYTDGGSEVGDIIIIKPTTQEQDELAEILETALEDNGTLKETAVLASFAARGVLGDQQVYTASGTYEKPSDLKFIIVEVQGGGGGGGGSSTAHAAGGGGGAGAYARKKILAADLGTTETVTIASGASGGSGDNNGSSASDTTFGAHITAGGGSGGFRGIGGGDGGSGGTATGGDINVNGGAGQGTTNTTSNTPPGGNGGASFFGGNGMGGANTGSGRSGGDGHTGGGGGGAVKISTSTTSGGDGGDGLVIVYEYF